MATEGDAPQDQSALAQRMEKEDGGLLTRTSGTEVDKHFQVEEKKVQALTEEPSKTMKTNSEVETTKELVAGNQGPRDGENILESPRLIPIAGEENSSSFQDYEGKDMINGADRKKSKTNLIDEELQYQGVEVSLLGTQPNAEEESQVLNKDETRCVVQEETTMHLQEATSEQTPEEKDHLPDSTQDINLEAAKLFANANQGAGQQKIFNISTASFDDPQEAGPPIKEEKDSSILSILHSKNMEPQGAHSSLNVEDETTKKVNFNSGIEDESDHTEVAKENFQDVEVQPHLLNVKNEPTEKAKNLSSFLRILSTEKECGSSHSEAKEINPQDAEMLPLSVIVGHETANEVESLSEHTGHASRVIECSKEHSETTEGNTQDVERLLDSINMENETTKEAEISSDLPKNASIARENRTEDHKVIEGTSEDPKILSHSVFLEDETTEEVECFPKHTSTVSTRTEYGTDPVTEANIHQAEILSPVEAEDQNMEKAEKLSVLAGNVSMENDSGIHYFEAAKAEISEDIEILSVNSLITPSVTSTSILDAEPGETSCEIKSNDNGKKKEIFELKRPDLHSANVSVSCGTDCPNKHEKEDIENGSPAENVSSPLVDSCTEEVLLRDVGQEKVQELEAHSGTMFEDVKKDTSDIKPAPVKEVSGIVPIVAKENQAGIGNLNRFLEEAETVKSTKSAMVEAEEKPESSSNDSVMEKKETSEKETQEQVIVELLAREDTKDEVSKGSIEASINVKVPVIPEIFNTEKDLEAPLFKTAPGKENHSESLKAASMSHEKIDSSQNFERKTSVQEERSIECSEGSLCEEKESTSNASKSKAEDSLQENTTIDGSNKEIDSAVLDDTAQETDEADQCPESTTILEELPPEGSSQELRSTTEAEDDKHEKKHLINIEDKTQQNDFPSRNDETFAPQSYTDNKRKLVEDLSVRNNRTKCLKGEEDYISDYEEIKSNDLEEAASELKEDHAAVKEVKRDTFSKDEERETHIIAKEKIVPENLSTFPSLNKQAAHPEANDVHKGEAIYSNDDEEIKGRGTDEGPPELKEDQSVAKEARKDTLGKHEEEEMKTVDKEATSPEVGNKGEAFYSNHNEEIKGHDTEEGPPELKNHIIAEEANKDTCSKDEEKEARIIDKEEVAAAEHVETNHEADDIHKGEVYSNDNEEIKAKDPAEAAQELKDYEILAKEVDREIFRDNKKTEIIENEKAATELVESSFTEENRSDHMITSEGTNPEGGEVHRGKADHLNDNKEIEGNVSVEGAPEPKEDQTAAEVKEGALELKEDQISAEQVVREIFREDDRKETQMIEKEEAGKELEESSFTEEIQSDHKVTLEAINPEAGEVHQAKADHLKDNKETEGNYSEEVAPEPKECQISAEELHKDTFRKDEEKVKRMIVKQAVATEYFVEYSVTEENMSHHKLLAMPVNPEADVHKHKGFYSNSDEKIRSIHTEEGASELKEDQVIKEEVNEETFSKDEKKGPQIIDKEVAATEYFVESSLAEENKFDKVRAEVACFDADERHKGKADDLNDDEEIKSNDSEKGAAKPIEDRIAAEAYKDTFSNDEEKEMQIIHKQEVATEYSVESSVAEEGKSSHEVRAEEKNLEAEKLHKAKLDPLNDDDVKDNGSDEEAPEPKEDQLQKDEKKEPQVMDKEEGATENLEEFSVADNKFDHEVTTKAMNTEDDDDHKGESVYRNDDENMEGNESDKAAAEPKEDHILAEEVMHTHKDMLFKVAEKETKNIEEEEAKEYLTESYVAEGNESDHKVTTEETDPEDNDVYKQAVHRNDDDEEIKGIDLEEGSPELKQDQILAKKVCKDTFSKDKKKDAQIIDKGEIAIHYLLESSVAEENKSNHMAKTEVKNPESDESHKGKVDHPNDDEVIEGNDLEVTPELNEEQIVEKEVYQEASSKDVEKETQTTDKEKVVTESLVPSIVETEKPTHEVEIEETKKEASDVHHYSAENLDAVGEKKSQKALQESILEDIITEDRMMTEIPSLEKTKEEFGSECDIVTSSAEEIKIEDSCEENQKGELDRERISQHHDIEKQISKENDSSKDCHTKSLEEEIVQESFQEAEANKQRSADIQMNIEEILNLAIPIPTQGERSIEGSLKNEEGNVMEPEKETKDMYIEGTTKNDAATYTAKEGEKVTDKNEENSGIAGDTAGTLRLAEGPSPTEYQGQAENSSTVPKISATRDKKMSEIMESAEIWPVEGSLKKEEWNILKPHKKRTKDMNKEDTTNNDEVIQSAQEGEMEAVKGERNADVAGDTAGTTRISEGLPPREHQEQGSIAEPEISEESKEEMLEVIQSVQEGEMEAVKEERNADVAGDTAGTTRISEGLPPREYQEQSSIAAPNISEESKEEMLVDTKVLTEIRSVEGSLIQEDWNVTEPEKEAKDLDKEGTMQDDDTTLSAQENEREDGLTEKLTTREYRELYENSSRTPDFSEETNENMLDATESAGIRRIKETLKQEERVVVEQEKETKDLHIEGTTQNDEATHTAREGETKTFKHEGNPCAADVDRLIKGLPQREYQEFSENSSAVLDISEERNGRRLDTTESKVKLVEGNSKKEEWDVKELEKEINDLDREATAQKDKDTLSAQEGETETVKHEGNPNTTCTTRLIEEFPPKKYQEHAENSSGMIDMSEEGSKKILDTTESIELRTVEETLKQEERVVIEQEKETEDLRIEGIMQNDDTTYIEEEGEKEMVRHEGNENAASTNKLAAEDQPENCSEVTELSVKSREKMPDTMKQAAIRSEEGSLKQEELEKEDVEMETIKREANPGDISDTNRLAEGLPPREYQEQAENSNSAPKTEQGKEKMLDSKVSTESEGSLKQEEWDVMGLEKEKKDLNREGIIQNDKARLLIKVAEKDMIKHEGIPEVKGTDGLTEEFPEKEYQELAQKSSEVPAISNEMNEKMLETKESTEMRLVDGTSKQEERIPMEQGKETKYLHAEGKTQNDEATHTKEEGQKDMFKHEGNPEAPNTDRLTKGLPAREYQELAEHSTAVPDISEERNETMSASMASKDIKLVEGSLKENEWNAMETEKAKKDLVREGTTEKDALSAKKGEKDMVKHKGNPDAERTNELTEELPAREYKELTENSSVVPDISKERNNKMLDVIGKETKDFDREGKTQKDEATLSAKEVEKDTVKNEVGPDAASINVLTEELPAREYQTLAGNSNVMPDITEQRNEKMLDITESIEIRPTKESLKQKELEVMELEKETKDMHEEGTIQNDEVTHSAYEGEKETVKNEGNANTAGTNRLAEELLPREHQELTDNSSTLPEISWNISNEKELAENSCIVPDITKERNSKMLDTTEKETKDLDREGKTKKDEATLSAKEVQKDTDKNEGSPDTASINLLIEELPAREYRELAENSNVMPDITEQQNEKMLDITESIEIRPAKESLKQKEWKVIEQEKETKYLHEECKEQNDEATHSAHEAEKETVKNEGNANAAGTNRIAEESQPREHQELAENFSTQHEISEESKERMLNIIESAEIIKDEESSKQEGWDVMGSGKETRDLDKEATGLNDEATLSAQECGKETIKHAGYPGATATDMLTEGLPPRECQEFAQNTSEVAEISEKSTEKMLDIMELTQIIQVEEILNQEEWNVMEPEKETKDLDKGMTKKDSATLSAQEGGKKTIKHEGIQDDALTKRLTEQLPPREYQELAENSCVMPHMSKEKNEIMSDNTEFKEIEPGEGSSKNEELDVMEPEKARDLHKEATTLNHEARLSAQEGKNETVTHAENPTAAVTHRLTEELPPRECQEPADNSNAMPDIAEKRDETMLYTIAAKEIKLVEQSSQKDKWEVNEPEKETKDLDREGRIQKDEATISAKEAVKHAENHDAAGTSRLTIKGLPLKDYKELGENSTVVADITEERNKKILDTIGSTEINPVEGISKQEEWDIVEPEKETKDLHIEGTTQNDEAAKEVEKKMVKHEGIANAAVTDRPAEELPGREYQELSENSTKVPETSEKDKKKMLDTMESTEIRHLEGSLKQEEWDVIKPENQTKDSDRDSKTDNHEATCSAQVGNKEMVNHKGIPDAVGSDRLTEVLPPTEYLDLAENSSVVPHISQEGNQKMLDITEATVKIPVEGRLKQDKLDVPEPEKKTKDVDIEVTVLNDEATHHFAQESTGQTKDVDLEVTALNNEATHFSVGETNTIEHEGKADCEGGTAVTVRFPQQEYKELPKSSSAMPRVSEKMLENMEPTEIAVMGEAKEVKLHENMQIDNNTPTPEKLEQEDALEAEVQPGSQTVEISEFIKNSKESAKMPRKDDTVGECSQNTVLEEKDAINKETTRISELKEEDAKSHSGNINSEAKILNEMVDSIELLYPEIDEDSHAQENIGRKDSEVNSTSTSAELVLDNVTAREYQELAENSSMVPDISQGKNEKMLDTIDSREIKAVKGSMKQKEWEFMEPETTENDEAINSAWKGDKEMMVKNEVNANVAGTKKLAEELQRQEHQELADKSSIVLEISEEDKEKMLEVMESTEVIQVEEILEQREWDVMKLENEIKDLDKDSATDNDEAPCSAQGGEKEMVKHEGIPDATCSDRLTEVLPPREFQELAENSCVVPDISGEGNHKMLGITQSTVIIPVEESLKQGELDVLEPGEKTKDVEIEGTIQNDEAMHSVQEGEREMMVKNEGNVNLAGTNGLAEELQQREHQELAENSCPVLEVSNKGKEKLLDTMESTEIIQVEENLEQQERDVIKLENEIKDSDRDGKTDNDAATCSAQGGNKMMVQHEGLLDAACIDRLTEVLPPREYQELAENFSVVPDISEGGNKMLDIRKSTVIIPVEGSLKQDECDVLEPEKKTKDVDIEVTTLNDDTTNFPPEGEANTIAEHVRNADAEGDTVVTIKIAEGLPQSKHKELVENSSATPEVLEKSKKEKMLDKMKPIQITVIGDNKEVKLQENMHLDNNTPTPEKVDQEAASECIKNSNESAKIPSHDENIGEPCQNSLREEKDTRDVKETTRISELQEEDGNSHSGNIYIEVNILNESAIQVDSSKVLVYPEIDEGSHVQGNIGRKEAEVTSTSISPTPLLDYIAARESPEELREIMVSEDKSVQVVNKSNKDHEKEEDAAEVDTNTLSLLECETPHRSPDEATCNTEKDTEVVNLEKQEDNTEKAGVSLTGSFEREQINTMEKIEHSHVTCETESTQIVRTSAQGRNLEDEEKQKMIETVPVEMEKLDTVAFSELEKSTTEEASANHDSTDSNNILPLPQEAIMKSSKAAADNLEPSKEELKEAPHWEEKETNEEEPLASKPREAFSASLSDLLQSSKTGTTPMTDDFPAEAEPNVENEKMKDLKTERAQDEEPKTDEEGEGDEDKRKESDNDSPVRVEGPSDTEMKAAHKSCNILSGVGSKVKRSIKKVKKAITGKSSHRKSHHQNKCKDKQCFTS